MIDFSKHIKGKRKPKDYGIPIQAAFLKEIGEYSENHKAYINKREFVKYKNIFVNICENDSGKLILKFYGGPTGFESYYLDDICADYEELEELENRKFCICGGTINRWDACYVNRRELYKFIKEVMGE